MATDSSRRNFIKKLGITSGLFALGGSPFIPKVQAKEEAFLHHNKRSAGAVYMGGFRAKPLPVVKLAFIGLNRGFTHVAHASVLDNVQIIAVCDLHQDLVERSVKRVRDKAGYAPKGYGKDPQDYHRMLEECKPDAVCISTDWATHVPIACACMEAGAHAFVEVPFSTSLDELWQLVNTSERTQKHCMMLENVNYGREELMYLNMTRQHVIGELLHGEAAYIHNLRDMMMDKERGEGVWRPDYMQRINGNLYPTHGLGPVAQYMNLARTEDQFDSIVSMSSPALGRTAYAKKKLPAEHHWNTKRFVCGDMNTSIIKTTVGRTIVVQWDETTPRPYSRHNLIQGTAGTLAGFPTRVAGEKLGNGNYHNWIEGEQLQAIYEQYDHPLWRKIGETAQKMGGHGGMDFVMMYRIVECLHKGEPLDQNVYEGAFWSAVCPLSAQSVAQGGIPVRFPDFTRGDWKTTVPLGIVC